MGGVLGRPGKLLGALGTVLVWSRSWELLGRLGTVLEAFLGPMHRKIENKTVQGLSEQTFEINFRVQKGAQKDPQTIPKRVNNQYEKCITCLSLLAPSWIGLEAILGPILVSKRPKP